MTGAKRGEIMEFQRTMEPVERQSQKQQVGLSAFQEMRLKMAPAMHHVVGLAREMKTRMAEAMKPGLSQLQRDAARAAHVQRPDAGHTQQPGQGYSRGHSMGM